MVFLFGLKHFYFECLSLKYTPALYVCVCVCSIQTHCDKYTHTDMTAAGCPLDGILHNYSSQASASTEAALWTMLVACQLLAACWVRVCVRVHLFLLSVCATSHNHIHIRTRGRRNSSSNAQLMSLGFIVRVVFAQIALPFRLRPVQ